MEDGGVYRERDAGPELDGSDGGPCTPGVPRCSGDFGYQVCEQEGVWSPPRSCAGYSEDGTSSYCIEVTGSDVPWATCVDPACWYWISRAVVPGPLVAGICASSTTIRRCNAGGTLSTAECDGICTQVGMLDGRALGFCTSECRNGAKECIAGPLYRECIGARWAPEPKECPAGATCYPTGSGATADIRCGGACDPGTSRCAADRTGIEVCSSAGLWEPGQRCIRGACRSGGPQAECEAECTPGQRQCVDDGADMESACADSYRWQPSALCPMGTRCRTSAGQPLGCVACLGRGNAYGVSDSRCDGGGVARCGEDNAWRPPSPCGDGTTCTELQNGASIVGWCARLPRK